MTNTFGTVSWRKLLDRFETALGESVYDYPNQSVIDFTDFVESLKQTEDMDSDIDTDDTDERLSLYFGHDRLIRHVELTNSREGAFRARSRETGRSLNRVPRCS